ncbi:MAG: cytochrome c family protein [Alphaproteobacteria bacterium]|jgi:cytochrome c|nr:cytochrome c family protein [Beijerinckiaceae bacterium]NBQ38617.1 cytochrome c family protein [Alphaproteobacteria bacterium]
MSKNFIFSSIAAAMLLATPAFADGDAAAGATVFVKCKACHENEQGVNKIGPTLKGVVGRKTASIADYKYSDAMAAKGAEGQVWDEATLAAYLPDPKAYVPGTKMAFAGLKNPQEVADVIAYLKSKP